MKKRKLEEAEAEENQSTPKRRSHTVKLSADEGFIPDSDAAEEEKEQKEEEGEEGEEEEDELKDKKKNKTKGRPESLKSESKEQLTKKIHKGPCNISLDGYIFRFDRSAHLRGKVAHR